MTRTERASYPRALNRDRSESRNGLDASLRKRGAGNHNWGSLVDEHRLEATAQDDEEHEFIEEEEGKSGYAPGGTFRAIGIQPSMTQSEESSKSSIERSTSVTSATSSGITEEDREKARNFRKNAFKKSDQIDLAAIARSSAAVSGSPPDSDIGRRSGSNNSQVII